MTCDYSTLAPEIVDDAYIFFTDIIEQRVRNKSNRVHYVLNGGHTAQTALIMLNLIPGMLVEGACTEIPWKEKGYIDIKLDIDDVSSYEFYSKRYYEYVLEHLSA